MSYSVTDTTIELTRGDSFSTYVTLEGYEPTEGDRIRFAMKKSYKDVEPVLVKEVPTDTMILSLRPADTKELAFGRYVYDMELTTAGGDVFTFITKGLFILTEEVY